MKFRLRQALIGALLALASVTAKGEIPWRDLLCYFEQGGERGAETGFDNASTQPMTIALLLRAQVVFCGKDCQQWDRARACVKWLLVHSDDDRDGDPGWGLPDAWDAFGDGTVNPANLPYHITTAMAADALLDACAVPGMVEPVQREKILSLLTHLFSTWSTRYSSRGERTFYWYSISTHDAQFVPNVSAYFAGVAQRFLNLHGERFAKNDLRLVQETVDEAIRTLIAAAEMRDGMAFWPYIAEGGRKAANSPNDIVHHAYILWGLETYRANQGRVKVPWSKEVAVRSLMTFFSNEQLHEYSQAFKWAGAWSDYAEVPAQLWGVGAALAYVGRFGTTADANRFVGALERDYAPPRYRISPRADGRLYPRHMIHVLWGFAELEKQPAGR